MWWIALVVLAILYLNKQKNLILSSPGNTGGTSTPKGKNLPPFYQPDNNSGTSGGSSPYTFKLVVSAPDLPLTAPSTPSPYGPPTQVVRTDPLLLNAAPGTGPGTPTITYHSLLNTSISEHANRGTFTLNGGR